MAFLILWQVDDNALDLSALLLSQWDLVLVNVRLESWLDHRVIFLTLLSPGFPVGGIKIIATA